MRAHPWEDLLSFIYNVQCVHYIYHVVHYLPSTYLFLPGSLYLLTAFVPSLNALPIVTTNLISLSRGLFVLFLFIYYFWLCWVFVAVRGLSLVAVSRRYSVAMRGCWGARASHCSGFSCCGARALVTRAQYLWRTGLVALRRVGSFLTRARTRVPCVGRRILNHCATREALFVCFWSIIDLQHYVSSCCTAQWFNISIRFKMITMINLVIICHHTKILCNYSLYIPHCTFHTWLIYFVTESLYLLIALTYFSLPRTLSPVATSCWFSVSRTLCLVVFVHLFCF